MAALAQNVTDRAHRYRAVANSDLLGPQRCPFCGSVQGIMVGHVDGHEENDQPDNLIWTCRSCNAIAANTMKKAGIGRRTVQMNPRQKSAGAQNLGEWVQAVGAIAPRAQGKKPGPVGSSDRNADLQAGSKMSVSDAVEMVRATPHSRRSKFAAELGKNRGRYNPATRSNLWPFSSAAPHWSEEKGGYQRELKSRKAAAAAKKKEELKDARDLRAADKYREAERAREDKRVAKKEALYATEERRAEAKRVAEARKQYASMMKDKKRAAKAVEYKGYRIYPYGDSFKSSIDRGESVFDTKDDAKRFIDDEVKMRRNPWAGSIFDESKESMRVVVIPSSRRVGMWEVVVNGTPRTTKPTKQGAIGYAKRILQNPPTRRNSAEAADYAYQKFHGRAPGEAVFLEDEEHVHEHLAVAGLLLELRVDLVTGYEALLTFEDDPPFLCLTEDGQQLYIEGGSQKIDLKELHFNDKKWIKDRMIIGQFSPPGDDLRDGSKAKWNIGYQAEKDFDNFEEILYQHDLGEETSIDGKSSRVREEDRVRPFLEYEPRNERLYITGGKYWINLPLIGTSPGIEN